MDVLVIGAGSIGERHARCFGNTGRARVAIVEPNEALRGAVRERYGLEHAYAQLEDALADRRFDAAVVATPAPLHIPIAAQLLAAPMHVLIEKPLSTTLDGIEAFQAALARSQRIAAVAYVYRAYPALADMHRAISGGEFGTPVQVVATCGQSFATYRPAYAKTYYASRDAGGGAVQDALTHVINAAEWLVGPVTRLVADMEHLLIPDVTVEDTVHVITRHGPVMGSFSLNQHQAPNEVTFSVVCQRGTARFELHKNRWGWMREPGAEWTYPVSAPLERDTAFMLQASAFLDAIEGRRPPLCSLQEGLQTLKVNLAILDSAQQGAWRSIGP